jgi:hypothetical protein
MACSDPHMVHFALALVGDVCRVWLPACSPPPYYKSGLKTIVDAHGVRVDSPVGQGDLTPGAPLHYMYAAGELFIINLLFDPTGPAGRGAEIKAEVIRGGVTVHSWCTTVRSGTPDPDFISYALKGP